MPLSSHEVRRFLARVLSSADILRATRKIYTNTPHAGYFNKFTSGTNSQRLPTARLRQKAREYGACGADGSGF